MAISDELNRIIQAKAGIKSALEEKGLTIGDSSTLDEYPALIQEMETGGGDGYPISTIIDLIERDITSIEIPNNTTKIGDYVFAGCNYLSSVTIPNTVTQIGAQAFQYCQGLHDITIPNSVITIGDNAFIQSGLSGSLYIPSSVTTIGNNAFKNCNLLTSVFIPSSVTTIGNGAFNTTNSSTDIVFLGTTPASLGNTTVFADTQMIYVKNAVVDTYKNAWSDYSSMIKPLADFTFNSFNNTVTAKGRNTLKLYIDSSLCDSSVYVFPGDDSSHIVTVESYDSNLGVLDSSTGEVYTPVELEDLSMPYLFKVSYNDGNQDVIVTKSDTLDNNSMITNDEWVNGVYNGTYTNTINPTISQLWIGDECEYIGDYNDNTYESNTEFIKGTTSKKLGCKKIVVSPNVTKIVGSQVFNHAFVNGCIIFLGDKPDIPMGQGLRFTGNSGYIYVPDEYLNNYVNDSSFCSNNNNLRPNIKALSEYDRSTFGDIIDPVPVQGE